MWMLGGGRMYWERGMGGESCRLSVEKYRTL
jgi:hypothetical protein